MWTGECGIVSIIMSRWWQIVYEHQKQSWSKYWALQNPNFYTQNLGTWLEKPKNCLFSTKKYLRSCKEEPSILKFLSFWYIIWWSTHSNALQKSKNIAMVICFCFLSVTSGKILWTELEQECPVGKPACELWMALFWVRKFVKETLTCSLSMI